MGGLNIYSDSVHLNLTNPAAFSELKYVNYSVGVDYNNFNLISDNSNEKATTANMNYLAVAIPTKKLAFGFGIMPKSSVGYLLQSTDNSTDPKQVNRYEGNGGVNTAFLTFGFKIFKKLRLGLSANYEFGNLEHSNSRYLDEILKIVKKQIKEISRIEFRIEDKEHEKDKAVNNIIKKDDNISFLKDSFLQYNRIDQNKSFNNFIIGASNKLAFEASKKVSENISHYNLSLIHI